MKTGFNAWPEAEAEPTEAYRLAAEALRRCRTIIGRSRHEAHLDRARRPLTRDPENEALVEIEDADGDRLFLWPQEQDDWTITVTDGTASIAVYLNRPAVVALLDALIRELARGEEP